MGGAEPGSRRGRSDLWFWSVPSLHGIVEVMVSHRIRPASLGLLLILTAMLPGCAYFAGKTVAAKDAPNFLIATDGSICVVSQERFDKTEVGMKALCAWRGGRVPQPLPKAGARPGKM